MVHAMSSSLLALCQEEQSRKSRWDGQLGGSPPSPIQSGQIPSIEAEKVPGRQRKAWG